MRKLIFIALAGYLWTQYQKSTNNSTVTAAR